MRAYDTKPNDYSVFGRRLRSQLEFPDLSPAPVGERADYALSIDLSQPPEPIELLGTREIAPDWVYKLYRVENGLRLEYGGTGSYGIYSGGRELVWYPGSEQIAPGVLLEMARAILLGPVMALALHQSGILCLHGSAVAIGSQAVAFLAPKLHGKSTLALALTAAGAQLMTDDLVAIDPVPPPVVLPGVHSVRVMEDIAERLGPRFSEATRMPGFKTTLANLPPRDLAWEPVPLAALYLVEPAQGLDNGLSVHREGLSRTRAAGALAHQKKLLDELVGYADAGLMLRWIATVVPAVPVYRLSILRDLERLPEVVREIMVWHRSPTTSSFQEKN